MPWTLFWQIVLLILIIWMVLTGLISSWYAARGTNRLLENKSERQIYSGSSDA